MYIQDIVDKAVHVFHLLYVAGDFDLFHVGHVDFLEKVSQEGDFIIVGLHEDLLVRKYKGHNYPIMNLHERVLSVLACRYVSEVVIGAPYSVDKALMDHFKIDLVLCPIASEEKVDDPYAYPRSLGKLKEIDCKALLRTEDVVERVRVNEHIYRARNAKKAIATVGTNVI
ncbi:Pect [Bugula neritina]|uniref:ethanolamine-phosphate cytidylyltransferase n=1 Tax=Bugula neritina TaxID=10212 RepID=A0A7J7J497_BUGNE|nr:Pect [Bugula neritina]